jgi:FtsP/CotA-like multicopper oxidase with cupredoxin domain
MKRSTSVAIIAVAVVAIVVGTLFALQRVPARTQAFTIIGGELPGKVLESGYVDYQNPPNVGFGLRGGEVTSPGPTLRVRRGEAVTITFVNVHGYISLDAEAHTFMVVRANDKISPNPTPLWGSEIRNERGIPPQPGESGAVTFVPDEAGEFVYICPVHGHAERGMWGPFIVEE